MSTKIVVTKAVVQNNPVSQKHTRVQALPKLHNTAKRVKEAKEGLRFRYLDEGEKSFIIQTANKKKVNLDDLNLGDLDECVVAFEQRGLFTICVLGVSKDYDTKVFDFIKTGVTKRTSIEDNNPERAMQISLWRAVLGKPIL